MTGIAIEAEGDEQMPETISNVTIRRLRANDAAALTRLAQRDSASPPSGTVLVAEADGELLAAVSLERGELVADPFRPTADAVSLLRLRARQLRGQARRQRRQGRATLPASPPGAGGRLLELPGANPTR